MCSLNLLKFHSISGIPPALNLLTIFRVTWRCWSFHCHAPYKFMFVLRKLQLKNQLLNVTWTSQTILYGVNMVIHGCFCYLLPVDSKHGKNNIATIPGGYLQYTWGGPTELHIANAKKYILTYLSSLGPRGLVRPARRLRHPSRSAAEATAASHDSQPSWFLSFSTVRLHSSLGRPRFLLPTGANVSAVLEILLGLFLEMWPIQRHLLTCMRVDTGLLPDASYSSSLLRW